MSPEQAEGKKPDARSDIFDFGAVLYEMLRAARPFRVIRVSLLRAGFMNSTAAGRRVERSFISFPTAMEKTVFGRNA